jgi:hypothetical protein
VCIGSSILSNRCQCSDSHLSGGLRAGCCCISRAGRRRRRTSRKSLAILKLVYVFDVHLASPGAEPSRQLWSHESRAPILNAQDEPVDYQTYRAIQLFWANLKWNLSSPLLPLNDPSPRADRIIRLNANLTSLARRYFCEDSARLRRSCTTGLDWNDVGICHDI